VRRLKRLARLSLEVLPVATVCRALSRLRTRELPVVLSFDVEPEERTVARGEPPPWRGFEEMVRRTPALRARLAALTGSPVPFSWFIRIDPQIEQACGSARWGVDRYAGELAALEAEGDEMALHTHTWRWDDSAGRWFSDQDPEWTRHCVRVGIDGFESAFGRVPETHRGGDHFVDGATLTELAARGVLADTTVEFDGSPQTAKDAGHLAPSPDYRGTPRAPYRSTPERFPAPVPGSTSDPLLIPIVGASREGLWRRGLLLAAHPSIFALRLLTELLRGSPPQVLVYVLRTDASHLAVWDLVVQNLEHLARHRGVRFITTAALARDGRPARSAGPSRPARTPAARTR
jgi:hypothetical protein